MTHGTQISADIARHLLKIEAVRLRPDQPYTWASGWKSPIYCDNRMTLSFLDVRDTIRKGFVEFARALYPQAEVVCGVATGGIPHGMLAADTLGLPFIYVRPAPKSHGLGNQVEGAIWPGKKVLVIEDLVSTGGSSLKAVQALRDVGYDVCGMLSVFSYGFPQAVQAFEQAGVSFRPLCTLEDLLGVAREQGALTEAQIELVRSFQRDPANWGTQS